MVVSADTLRLGVVRQVALNTVPSNPVFQLARITGEGLSFTPSSSESSELDSLRSVRDTIITGGEVNGDVNFELSKNAVFEMLLEAALCNVWGTVGGAGGSITADQLVVGDTLHRHLFEKRFTVDAHAPAVYSFHRYLDCAVNTFNLSISPNDPITGSFGLIGSSMQDPAATEISGATYVDAGTNPVFQAPLVADIKLDRATGTDIALTTYCFNSLSMSLTNNIKGLTCIGFLGNKDSVLGRCNITLTANVYFADDEVLKMLKTYEEFAVTVELRDALATPNKHFYKFQFPRCKFSSVKVVAGGSGQDVLAECAITALLPTATPKSQMIVTRGTV